jgi:hypothetical protein
MQAIDERGGSVAHSRLPPGAAPAQRGSVLRGRIIFAVAIALILAVVAFFFFGRGWIASYDKEHPVALDCRILSSKASAVSTHSGRGIGSYTDQVDIQTANCGHLVLRDGITSENSDEIASKFRVGKTYRITLGEGSLNLRTLLSVLGTVPEVRGYKRI